MSCRASSIQSDRFGRAALRGSPMIWIVLGIVAALAISGLVFWRWRRRKSHRLISFVALLREPVNFDPAILAKVAGKAWNADLGDGENEGADGFVACADIVNTIVHE